MLRNVEKIANVCKVCIIYSSYMIYTLKIHIRKIGIEIETVSILTLINTYNFQLQFPNSIRYA